MSEKRFTRGKGLFQDGFFTETINDKKTGERYYDGVKSNYQSSIEIVKLLNSLWEENEQLRQTVQHLEEECGARENDIVKLREMNRQLRELQE